MGSIAEVHSVAVIIHKRRTKKFYFRISFYFAEKCGCPFDLQLTRIEAYFMIQSYAHLGLNDFFSVVRKHND